MVWISFGYLAIRLNITSLEMKFGFLWFLFPKCGFKISILKSGFHLKLKHMTVKESLCTKIYIPSLRIKEITFKMFRGNAFANLFKAFHAIAIRVYTCMHRAWSLVMLYTFDFRNIGNCRRYDIVYHIFELYLNCHLLCLLCSF